MDAWNEAYSTIVSEPFDGTVMPIAFIPDWTKTQNQNKNLLFQDIPIRDFIPLPRYNLQLLHDATGTKKDTIIARYTYIVPYMGAYTMSYKENEGSHLAVDIRAPVWTPVLSIANGVVVRTIDADATGNRVVVIRHDGIPWVGKQLTLYSAYEHLSEITVQEWKKIDKGWMLGRVGITGITTTPHLHFQIDTADAPFHPYWPFSSKDMKIAWLDFMSAINVWLWKSLAEEYTVHPMNLVQFYLDGVPSDHENSRAIQTVKPENVVVASTVSIVEPICREKRFSDLDEDTVFGSSVYALSDAFCLFQSRDTFDGREEITRKEALQMIMKVLKTTPLSRSSDMLDIGVNDPISGYIARARQLGAVTGSYFYPDATLTKQEFISLLVRLRTLEKNPLSLPIYTDVSEGDQGYQDIQDYGYAIHAKHARFYPESLVTRGIAVTLLSNFANR